MNFFTTLQIPAFTLIDLCVSLLVGTFTTMAAWHGYQLLTQAIDEEYSQGRSGSQAHELWVLLDRDIATSESTTIDENLISIQKYGASLSKTSRDSKSTVFTRQGDTLTRFVRQNRAGRWVLTGIPVEPFTGSPTGTASLLDRASRLRAPSTSVACWYDDVNDHR